MTRVRFAGADLYDWMALRRAHKGGVANLAGHWLDSGRPVPGYVADALDGLTSTGLLALGEADPESCGVRRVLVTETGSAWCVALCQVHDPTGRVAVGTPCRWVCSPYDQRSHLLAKRGSDQIGIVVAVCGHRMPWSVNTSAQSTTHRCPTCQALASVPVLPVPRFGHSPDSGRPPVEQHPRLIPAPGSRSACNALTDAGLLALADPEPPGLRWITLTAAGRARYAQLVSARETSRCPGVQVPDPQFPHKTPAGRRSSVPVSLPAPGGQPESNPEARESGAGQLRWARCLHDERLHLLEPADVAAATTGSPAQALHGRTLPAESLIIVGRSPGALCMACVDGIPSDLGPRGVL
jgi:hypothetical protein